MDFKIDKEVIDKIPTFKIKGDLDVYSIPQVREAVNKELKKGSGCVIINLEKTTYIDPSGLGVLIGFLTKVRGQEGFLGLVVTTLQIKIPFHQITRLYRIFNIFKSQEEALVAAKEHLSKTAEITEIGKLTSL